MDPDANLREQRELTARALRRFDDDEEPDSDDVFRLCELIEALDEWLSKGGYLPRDWRKANARKVS